MSTADALAAPPEPQNRFSRLCAVLEEHNYDPSRLIPILQSIQEEYTYLPEEVLTYTATALGLSPAQVYGVASFYAHFNLEPKGKHLIRLCAGTACHVKGTPRILEAVRDHLHLRGEETTTPDHLFTVETVSCLGACGLAPAMVIDGDIHGQLTPESAVELVEAICEQEGV